MIFEFGNLAFGIRIENWDLRLEFGLGSGLGSQIGIGGLDRGLRLGID